MSVRKGIRLILFATMIAAGSSCGSHSRIVGPETAATFAGQYRPEFVTIVNGQPSREMQLPGVQADDSDFSSSTSIGNAVFYYCDSGCRTLRRELESLRLEVSAGFRLYCGGRSSY